MKLSTVLLLLVAASVALASPQRSSRRFRPGQGQEAAQANAEADVAAEVDLAEAEEPAAPFTPAAPVIRAPTQASPSRPRTRGSRTFIESIKHSNIPVEASQLEELEKSTQGLQRIASRPASRPSTRVSTSAAPAPPTPSRPTLVRPAILKPNAITEQAEEEAAVSFSPPTKTQQKSSGNDPKSRRQKLLSLRKKPGAANAPPSVEMEMAEEEAAQAPAAEIETPELNVMEKTDDTMKEKSSAPKLDEAVSETLDESIKSEKEQEGEVMKKKMEAKETAVEEKMPEEGEPSEQSPVSPQPEISTTTAAPASSRRVNSLSKLRASRPVSDSSSRPARPRSSVAASATPAAAPAADAQPRLSSRRGGRGNSRGGAALATATRISRPNSRVPATRASATDEEAEATQPEAPAAGTTGRLEARRRG